MSAPPRSTRVTDGTVRRLAANGSGSPSISQAEARKIWWSQHAPAGWNPPCSVRATPGSHSTGRRWQVAQEHERRLAEYERQVGELQSQLKALEEEVVVLRRRLQDAPKRVRTLEERLLETKGQLAQAVSQNERLSATLREAREHIAALREEVEK